MAPRLRPLSFRAEGVRLRIELGRGDVDRWRALSPMKAAALRNPWGAPALCIVRTSGACNPPQEPTPGSGFRQGGVGTTRLGA